MSVVDSAFHRHQASRSPHSLQRKPVAPGVEHLRPLTKLSPDNRSSYSSTSSQLQPQQQQQQQQFQSGQPSPNLRNSTSSSSPSSRSHSRTTSSNTLPNMNNTTQPYVHAIPGNPPAPYNPQWPMGPGAAPARRTLSNATTSTTSTNGPPQRKPSSSSSTLQRSTSNRSGTSQSSYVALMRKQKATVWSDRAQHEDARILAQQRAAKARAVREIAGAHPSLGGRMSGPGSSSLTGGVRSKIRHHGAPKAQQYNPSANPASGVPMRLSAREVDEDDSDDDYTNRAGFHQRSGSGRSSVGSAGRVSSSLGLQMTPGHSSGNSTPPIQNRATQETRGRSTTEESKNQATPMPDHFRGADYFTQKPPEKTEATSAHSTGSTNSSEREAGFGGIGGLPKRVKDEIDEQQKMDDLQRRGSVDERTTTMRGFGRLYVANPDLSD